VLRRTQARQYILPPALICELFDQITAGDSRAVSDREVRELGRPQAEPCLVLACQHSDARPHRLRARDPLTDVQHGRVRRKLGWIERVTERIDGVADERLQLKPDRPALLRTGHWDGSAIGPRRAGRRRQRRRWRRGAARAAHVVRWSPRLPAVAVDVVHAVADEEPCAPSRRPHRAGVAAVVRRVPCAGGRAELPHQRDVAGRRDYMY
jgi:hypothetical protein